MLGQRCATSPELLRALADAAGREMTAEEMQKQRESWARANKPTGDPRFD